MQPKHMLHKSQLKGLDAELGFRFRDLKKVRGFHINGIHELIDKVDGDTTENANCLWAHLEKVNVLCKTTITFIGSLQLPPLCDYILQATDAGPGVGVSNVEVKYRDVEMSRINEWMHMNRIHRAPHDSSQNEAERSNAAIGEALVDGRALKWEYFKPADIMNEEEFKKLTVAEIKKLEAETMERNAWKVSEEVVSRIDGEPGPAGDCMKAFVTKKNDQQFFFNTEYLQKYAGKSEKKKVQVPGHHYFKKIDSIIATCMSSGEMFHEYCVDQAVPPTPRPVPDITKLPNFHYLPLEDTPIRKENGNRREVDDFHPRARLRALHKEKAINVEDALSVKAFCNKYIVEENLVKSYLEHLNHLEMMNDKRKTETRDKNLQENNMSCEDFDWQKMFNEGTLAKQHVCILDKYIEKYNLSAVRNKKKNRESQCYRPSFTICCFCK
ncbi:RNA-directed DNA polymerase from transposon X-element [Paramuricea clavata]|uniref:RNA-directed DNA polymerase from transposon X-element n=1 Tax=Paramuricea clavata TaxID=317549 RepID=A0A7D9HNG3_PARCT|nr:RNA-directed DNA polymerase from transposon X-element [Paramuricea clavata]